MSKMIGSIEHPIHGVYYIFFDSELGCYGISKVFTIPVHCGYASLTELFKTKGL